MSKKKSKIRLINESILLINEIKENIDNIKRILNEKQPNRDKYSSLVKILLHEETKLRNNIERISKKSKFVALDAHSLLEIIHHLMKYRNILNKEIKFKLFSKKKSTYIPLEEKNSKWNIMNTITEIVNIIVVKLREKKVILQDKEKLALESLGLAFNHDMKKIEKYYHATNNKHHFKHANPLKKNADFFLSDSCKSAKEAKSSHGGKSPKDYDCITLTIPHGLANRFVKSTTMNSYTDVKDVYYIDKKDHHHINYFIREGVIKLLI